VLALIVSVSNGPRVVGARSVVPSVSNEACYDCGVAVERSVVMMVPSEVTKAPVVVSY